MRAIVFDEFGGPEVLHLAEVPDPVPGPGQIRVAVRAAGVNPYDGKLRSGAMEPVVTTVLPVILGLELAGIVDTLGEGVEDVAVGDRVFGWAQKPAGSYAELALSKRYGRVPDNLDFTRAVTLPVAAETSQRALGMLNLQPGETLLIHGVSGSVGGVATQFALRRGVTVIGTASAENQERVRALGAIATTYGGGLVERVRALAPGGVDAVLDTSGKGALRASIELRGGTERIVSLADPEGPSLGITMASGGKSARVDLTDLARQLADRELETTIGGIYSFDEAAKAAEANDSGHAGGKVVLVP